MNTFDAQLIQGTSTTTNDYEEDFYRYYYDRCISCNVDMRVLPDMYVESRWLGVYILGKTWIPIVTKLQGKY